MSPVKSLAAVSAFAALAMFPLKSYAWGIEFQDTYLNLRYVPGAKDPGFTQNLNEVAGNISYANGWTYGSNFASIDLEDYGHGDLSNSTNGKANNNSFEFYGVFRSTLSGNKISGTNDFSFGPIRDVGLELGIDVATQNDQFAGDKKMLIAGPQFSINLPRGFWTVTLAMSKEWNNNAFLTNGTGTNYNPTYEIETAWSYPFAIGPIPFNLTGFANFVGPKGSGATGDSYHREEILFHPKLMVDVGELAGYTPKKIEAGIGFEYWHNKFGVPASAVTGGTEQRSVFVEVGYHF